MKVSIQDHVWRKHLLWIVPAMAAKRGQQWWYGIERNQIEIFHWQIVCCAYDHKAVCDFAPTMLFRVQTNSNLKLDDLQQECRSTLNKSRVSLICQCINYKYPHSKLKDIHLFGWTGADSQKISVKNAKEVIHEIPTGSKLFHNPSAIGLQWKKSKAMAKPCLWQAPCNVADMKWSCFRLSKFKDVILFEAIGFDSNVCRHEYFGL